MQAQAASNASSPMSCNAQVSVETFDLLLQRLRALHVQEVQDLKVRLVKTQMDPSYAATSPPTRVAEDQAFGLRIAAPIRPQPTLIGAVRSSRSTPVEPTDLKNINSMEAQPGPAPVAKHGATRRFSEALRELQMKEDFDSELSTIVDTPRRTPWIVERVINHEYFESVFSVLIVINCVVVAAQVQLEGWDAGAQDGFTRVSYVYEDDENWARLMRLLDILGDVLGTAFVLEGTLKLAGLGPRKFAADTWNLVDALISATWVVGLLDAVSTRFRTGSLRSLRLFRLLRILRVLKKIRYVDRLFLLNAALRGSVGVLLWSLLYLTLIQITIALILTEGLHSFYLNDDTIAHDYRKDVFDFFGTGSRATLTMFELTLANWPPACRVMADAVGEWWIFFAILHKLSFGFALVGIINGAVMQETFKAAHHDSNVLVHDKKRAREELRQALRQLFESVDGGKGGVGISLSEFTRLCKNPVLKLWLSSIGLNTADASKVFALLDNGDGKLSMDEFLDGVERFRGVASGIDLHIAMLDIHEKLRAMSKDHRASMRALLMQLLPGLLVDQPAVLEHDSSETWQQRSAQEEEDEFEEMSHL